MQYNVGPFAQILMLPTDLLRGKFPYFFLSNLKHVISSIILHRVCKSEISPVPSLLWPVPIKSHLSKKPPLPPCLPSLPLLPLGSFFCLPLLIFSPWSLTPPPLPFPSNCHFFSCNAVDCFPPSQRRMTGKGRAKKKREVSKSARKVARQRKWKKNSRVRERDENCHRGASKQRSEVGEKGRRGV